MEISASSTPIVCDMTDASDTAEERMAEYGRLFAQALTGRERTDQGVRLRFRADDDPNRQEQCAFNVIGKSRTLEDDPLLKGLIELDNEWSELQGASRT